MKSQFKKEFVTKDGFVGTGITKPEDVIKFIKEIVSQIEKEVVGVIPYMPTKLDGFNNLKKEVKDIMNKYK